MLHQQQQTPPELEVTERVGSPREAMRKVADSKPEQVQEPDRSDALEWYLSAEPESVASAVVPVNVAPAGHPEHIIDFTVQVIGADKLRQIRRSAIVDSVFNDMEFALQVCANGIIDPPIRDMAPAITDHPDPAERLKARLAHKPGVIDALSEKILEISGWGGGDVREVKAAGN